jgi:hypothetical protein
MSEQWLPAVRDSRYLVSNQGGCIGPHGHLLTDKDRKGRPVARIRRRRVFVHVLIMETFIGPCPEGQEVRHLNDVKNDNRLENLAYGTRSQNMLDLTANGRNVNRNKTHCPAFHEYNDENTRWYQGRRYCRPCLRDWKAAHAQ